MGATRIIVAGWRGATERDHQSIVESALYPLMLSHADRPWEVTVVHGQCHLGGVDLIADRLATQWRIEVERHPAQGHPTQDFGPWPTAGPRRNKHMASLGADHAYLFPHRTSHRGTFDSMGRELVRARIPFTVIPIE